MGTASRDTAATFAAEIIVEGRPYSDMFTATANTGKNESRYATGLNFYPYPKSTNNFNIKVWWQYVAPKVGVGTNEFTVQMQVFYF